MGFISDWKDAFRDASKDQVIFSVIGGQNFLPRSDVYRMISEEKQYGEGVVKIEKKLFYFLGFNKEEKYTRSAGKAAAGAIVGGVLTGGVGAIVGAAVGGRKKDDSVYWIDFADYETKREFSVQVKMLKYSPKDLTKFHAVDPVKIGLDR